MPAITHLLADRLPVITMLASVSWVEDLTLWFSAQWESVLEWAAQPHIAAVLIAWIVTFCLVCVITLGLGFGPAGVAAGSVAAAFQSFMYAGFTPAGGVFATLTSMGMLGALMPAAVITSMVLATAVSVVVFLCGVGR